MFRNLSRSLAGQMRDTSRPEPYLRWRHRLRVVVPLNDVHLPPGLELLARPDDRPGEVDRDAAPPLVVPNLGPTSRQNTAGGTRSVPGRPGRRSPARPGTRSRTPSGILTPSACFPVTVPSTMTRM